MMKFRLLLMIAALFFPGPPESVSPGEETFEAFRDRQMRALRDPKTTRETRLQALEWVGKNARSVDNAEATTAVEKCLRDPDAKVRAAAIEPRASLAIAAKMTCPPSVLGAMLDADQAVRENAINWSGAYPPRRLSQDAAPVLLRCLKSADHNVRSLAALLMGDLPTKDDTIVQAVRDLTADKHIQVRSDAHSALFRITSKLEDIVPFCLRFRVERHDASPIQTEKLPAEEQARRNLIALGIAVRLYKLAEERTDDFARHLLGLLSGEDAVLRRGTALYLARYFHDQSLPAEPRPVTPHQYFSGERPPEPEKQAAKGALSKAAAKEFPDSWLLDPSLTFDPEAQRKQLEASAKKHAAFRQRLHELGLEKQLRRLRDGDPEALVRGAAAQALVQIDALQKKKATAPRQPDPK